MWIVRLALRRPYTFVVPSLLLLLLTPFVLLRTPTDIFPAINIPVVSIVWSYTGLGGEQVDMEECQPLLECIGNRVVYCGGQGMGASLKMVMNQLLGTVMAAFSEGLVLGESLGLSRQVLFEALLNGPAAAPFLAVKRKRIEKHDYGTADFPLRWLQKDLHLASVSAYETGVSMPLTNVAKEIYRLAIREGDGDMGFSAIYRYLARNQEVKKSWNEHPEASEGPSNKAET